MTVAPDVLPDVGVLAELLVREPLATQSQNHVYLLGELVQLRKIHHRLLVGGHEVHVDLDEVIELELGVPLCPRLQHVAQSRRVHPLAVVDLETGAQHRLVLPVALQVQELLEVQLVPLTLASLLGVVVDHLDLFLGVDDAAETAVYLAEEGVQVDHLLQVVLQVDVGGEVHPSQETLQQDHSQPEDVVLLLFGQVQSLASFRHVSLNVGREVLTRVRDRGYSGE